VLEKEGLRVMSAMQGRLGVALALDHRPSLILLDLNLPDTHGLDVLRALAGDTRTAQVPVIVVTADVTPGQRSKAIALGAVAVLTKPLDISKFLETVSLHVSGIGEPCPRG
jgi:DNA-binding response OmpR family regulator